MKFINMKNLLNILFIIFLLNFCECKNIITTHNDDNDDDDSIDLSSYGNSLFGTPDKNVGEAVNQWNEKDTFNPEEIGSYLEGDILHPISSQLRNGMIHEAFYWSNGVVPFEIHGNFDARAMDLIEKSFMEYHDKTCIKFVRRSAEKDYIVIQSENTGCWSSVGRNGGAQIVNLQTPGCTTKVGTIIHELMHTIGFMHEQNREERDDFIYVIRDNIIRGLENNFDKAERGSTSGFGVGYDYGSVMHYSANAFSRNQQATLVPKSSHNNVVLGQREGFSASDVEKIRRMYKCSSTTSSTGYKPQVGPIGAIINGFINSVYPKTGDEDKEEMLK